MLACKFGCDDLFEQGYISVKDGRFIELPKTPITEELERYISKLKDNVCDYYSDDSQKIAIFLNTRTDRQMRTQQLLDIIFSKMTPDYLIVRGDNLEKNILSRCERMGEIKFSLFNNEESTEKIISKFSDLENYLIVGIGNIVGWGENFARELKGYKSA